MGAPVVLEEELATGPRRVWAPLLKLAAPTIGAGWLKSSYQLADTLVAGRLSTESLAALSTAVLFVWMFHSLSATNAFGSLSRVAQATGAGDADAVRALLRRSLVFALALGVVVSLAFALALPRLLPLLDVGEAVYAPALRYLLTVAAFGPFFWLLDTLEQSFRGLGDARTPLFVTGAFALVNLGLNPLFAFGVGPLPALGLVGVGVATGLSWIGGAATLLLVAHRRGLLRPSTVAPPRPFDLWRVGLPTAMSGVAFDIIWVLLVPTLAQNGPAALAAVAVGHRLESVAYLSALGVGIACASLVGQAVGMRDAALARRVAFTASLAAFGFAAAWIAALFAFGRELFGLFTSDPAVVAVGLDYVTLATLPVTLQAVEVVIVGAFSGTGRTTLPNVLLLLAYGARVPLALAWAPLLGAQGVFLAIGLTAAVAGTVVALAFYLVGGKRPDVLPRREVIS